MELIVAAVGQRMPAWIAEGWESYRRRMPPHLSMRLIEIPSAARLAGRQATDRESEMLLAKTPAAHRIALDPDAKGWSTARLARELEGWQQNGRPVCFYIGGATGLSDALITGCDQRWSLGPLTLPHMLVRVVVAEQLYRAWTILTNHPYHRA